MLSRRSSVSSRAASSPVGRCLRRNAFVLLLISSVAVGIALGVGLRYAKPNWTARELAYFKFPGELLLRMLQMMIIPLVVTSMISGMSSMSGGASSKIGLRAVVFYMVTTVIAVVIGIVVVVTIRPGVSNHSSVPRKNFTRNVNAVDSLLDLIRNAFPDNIASACCRRVQTKAMPAPPPNPSASNNGSDAAQTSTDYVPVVEEVWGSNILGLIVFSIGFGVALNYIGEQGQVVRQFFIGFCDAVLEVVQIIIWFTPVGIVFLISGKIIEMKDMAERLTQLGFYLVTVIAGLVIHGFIVLPLIYLLVVRRNPFRYMYGCLRALLTAVSTASSSATLPVTLYCIEEVNRVSKQVSRFVVPVGATINMDGTALYEAVAAVFIAQVNGISLNVGQLIIISVTATAAAVGAAGIPEAGLVTMLTVLTAVGLPTDDVALILPIDWFLDRLRTSINVWGDCVGAGVVEALSLQDLLEFDADGDDESSSQDAPETGGDTAL